MEKQWYPLFYVGTYYTIITGRLFPRPFLDEYSYQLFVTYLKYGVVSGPFAQQSNLKLWS